MKKLPKQSKLSLKDSFKLEQEILSKKMILASNSIEHPSSKGDVVERHFIKFLRKYLPQKFGIRNGFIIDSLGNTSEQIDIIIHDNFYSANLLKQNNYNYTPIESVYAVIEVKSTITSSEVDYSNKKYSSVKKLIPKTSKIRLLDGSFADSKDLPLFGGLVGVKLRSGDRLTKNIQKKLDDSRLSQCLVLTGSYYEKFTDKPSFIINSDSTLMNFTFNLLHKLSMMGNPPSIDWLSYMKLLED